jgi:hypothetical protein
VHAFRTSICTVKILQCLCVSHKIVETYRNEHASRFPEGNTGTEQNYQSLSHLRMWQLLRPSDNIGKARRAWPRGFSLVVREECSNPRQGRSLCIWYYASGENKKERVGNTQWNKTKKWAISIWRYTPQRREHSWDGKVRYIQVLISIALYKSSITQP